MAGRTELKKIKEIGHWM